MGTGVDIWRSGVSYSCGLSGTVNLKEGERKQWCRVPDCLGTCPVVSEAQCCYSCAHISSVVITSVLHHQDFKT